LVDMGQAGEIQAVAFPRPDRLGRDGEMAFFYYMHLLERTGRLEVRFAVDDVPPDSPYREDRLFKLAFSAKDYAKKLRKNTLDGRKRRAKAGKMPTGNVPWCFRYESKAMYGNRASEKIAKCRNAANGSESGSSGFW
ncbi:MAG: recombinase family protein, partial [Chloroflexi bacterium]|nr:recombinase family protein [Chloroflexota bacterium]